MNKYKAIIDLIKKKQLFIFVGAGISIAAPSNLKNFSDLKNEIVKSLCTGFESIFPNHEAIIEEIISTIGDIPPEYIFSLMKNNIITADDTDDNYHLSTLKVFKNSIPNNNHRTIAQLLNNNYINAIFTTNFDTLIEDAFLQLNNSNTTVNKCRKLWRQEHFVEYNDIKYGIIKLHGCISDIESIVISFDEIGNRCNNQGLNLLKYYLTNYHVLFSGYSGNDLDIYNLLVATKCKGIFWNALTSSDISQKIYKLLKHRNGVIVEGNLNEIFDAISKEFKLTITTYGQKIFNNERSPKDLLNWANSIDVLCRLKIIGNIFEYKGKWARALQLYGLGCDKSQNKMVKNLFWGQLAGIYYKTGDYKNALLCCKSQLENAKQVSLPARFGEHMKVLQLKGLIKSHKDSNAALKLFERALKYQEELEKYDPLCRVHKGNIYTNIGNLFYKNGYFDVATTYYQSALSIYDEYGDINGRAKALSSLGNIYFIKGQIDNCILYYKESEYLFLEINDAYELPIVASNLALVYEKKGDKTEALRYAHISKSIYQILSMNAELIEINKIIKRLSNSDL